MLRFPKREILRVAPVPAAPLLTRPAAAPQGIRRTGQEKRQPLALSRPTRGLASPEPRRTNKKNTSIVLVIVGNNHN